MGAAVAQLVQGSLHYLSAALLVGMQLYACAGTKRGWWDSGDCSARYFGYIPTVDFNRRAALFFVRFDPAIGGETSQGLTHAFAFWPFGWVGFGSVRTAACRVELCCPCDSPAWLWPWGPLPITPGGAQGGITPPLAAFVGGGRVCC